MRPVAAAAALVGARASAAPSEAAERAAVDAARAAGDYAALARAVGALAAAVGRTPGRSREAIALAEQALALQQALDPISAPAWQAYATLSALLAAAGDAADLGAEERTRLRARAAACKLVHAHAPRLAAALARLPADADEGRALLGERLARCLAVGGRADLAQQLAPAAVDLEPQAEPSRRPDADVVCDDTETVDWIFEPDLLLEGGAEQRFQAVAPAEPLDAAVRPVLIPGLRTSVDDDGVVRLSLPRAEPVYAQRPGCLRMTRLQRDVLVVRASRLLWALTRALDGERPVFDVLANLEPDRRAEAATLLGTLAAAGVVDVSGRAHARHMHGLTKKGVLAGGGLNDDDVMRLATDREWRQMADARSLAVGLAVPPALGPLHVLTRARRSRREYAAASLTRAELDAVLHTACGVTGEMAWRGRRLPLRAYPSSGALYAVEICPVLLRVEGMRPSVCLFRPEDSRLLVTRDDIDPASIAAAALPVERAMVTGAAAMICLTGRFARHERKYGEGGYRMLVAEAGHVSQNLVLAATALGLAARPFGGVFDTLLNQALGLEGDEEQFLLAVLVGRAGAAPGG